MCVCVCVCVCVIGVIGRVCFLIVTLPGQFLITKTSLYNSDPLKPNFYIVKLGVTLIYIIFLMYVQKQKQKKKKKKKEIDCGYSLDPPC